MGLFVGARPFDSPAFLAYFSGLANVNYAKCRHVGRLSLCQNARNLRQYSILSFFLRQSDDVYQPSPYNRLYRACSIVIAVAPDALLSIADLIRFRYFVLIACCSRGASRNRATCGVTGFQSQNIAASCPRPAFVNIKLAQSQQFSFGSPRMKQGPHFSSLASGGAGLACVAQKRPRLKQNTYYLLS